MDWDKRYKNNDKPWDKGSATPVLTELISNTPQYFLPQFSALIPGCGIGHDIALLEKHGLTTTGLDISEEAIRLAKQTYPELKTTWLNKNIFTLKNHPEKYDLIWEHTCYCAILPELRNQYIDQIDKLMKPGAYFAGVFFTDTGQPPEIGPPFSTTTEDIIQNFGRKLTLLWEAKPQISYPGRENREYTMIWQKN